MILRAMVHVSQGFFFPQQVGVSFVVIGSTTGPSKAIGTPWLFVGRRDTLVPRRNDG